MIWLAWIILSFLGLRVIIAMWNLLTRQWLKEGTTKYRPMVSILIPARNEQKNIGLLLEGLLKQTYSPFEILVYDDLSEDGTWDIIINYSNIDSRIKGIRGGELPSGWIGKNFACHQLAKEANGSYLLFMDADVIPHPQLIESAMAHVQAYDLHLLSLFPSQIMITTGEKITVPLMNWVLLSLLPLSLTRSSPLPAFSAANGQFMMFEASTYMDIMVHKTLRSQKSEDIMAARLLKSKKLKIQTLLGGTLIGCHMYDDFSQSVYGFSKNILDFFGGSILAGPVFMIITTLGLIPVGIVFGLTGIIIYLILAMSLRLIVSLSSGQNPGQNVLLWPLQHAAFVFLIAIAVRNKILAKNTWKGRIIDNI